MEPSAEEPLEDADEEVDPVKAACLQELFDELQFVHREMQVFDELFKPASSSGFFSGWLGAGTAKATKNYPEHIYLISPAWWNLWCERVDYKKYERLLKQLKNNSIAKKADVHANPLASKDPQTSFFGSWQQAPNLANKRDAKPAPNSLGARLA